MNGPVHLSIHKSKAKGHRGQNKFCSKLSMFGLWFQFEFTNGYEVMQKAWSGIEEVPYCFWKSSVKFQGHMGWKIDLDLIKARLQGHWQLSNSWDWPCSVNKWYPYCGKAPETSRVQLGIEQDLTLLQALGQIHISIWFLIKSNICISLVYLAYLKNIFQIQFPICMPVKVWNLGKICKHAHALEVQIYTLHCICIESSMIEHFFNIT